MTNDPQATSFTIHPATTPDDINAITALFTSYATWLDLDLSFQSFTTELSSLPGPYSPPTGCLLLARNPNPLGCVAIRPLSPSTCEMKRLFVLPEGRGIGVGVALIKEAVQQARGMGYQVMKLDTLPSRMGRAVELYKGLGFEVCERYYDSPIHETVFLEKDLRR